MSCTYGYYLTYTCLWWLSELSCNCKVICGMLVYKWKRGAATGSVKWDILRNEQAPVEEFLCTYIWYTLLFHLPTIWMDVCSMFACAAVVAAPILQLWVLYWVLSKPSFDSKVSRSTFPPSYTCMCQQDYMHSLTANSLHAYNFFQKESKETKESPIPQELVYQSPYKSCSPLTTCSSTNLIHTPTS